MTKRILTIIIGLCVVLAFAGCKQENKTYEDTDGEGQEVSIWLQNNDATATGGSVKLSKGNRGIILDCNNLEKGKKAYVYLDGNISSPLAELTPANYTFSLKLKIPRKNLDKGEHAIQVVQFNKDEVIFCKTAHYTVE